MESPGFPCFMAQIRVSPVSRRVQKLVAENDFGERVDQEAFIRTAGRAERVGKQLTDTIAFERKRLDKRVVLGLVNVMRQTRPERVEVDEELESHRLPESIEGSRIVP